MKNLLFVYNYLKMKNPPLLKALEGTLNIIIDIPNLIIGIN
jgi:hypothetical protein